ncbi:MAG TPA: hypothetical protein VGK73_14235 [Polyangiaceae bacterium]
MPERFTRQTRLAEIGAAGQARLAAARVTLADDAAGTVAAAYLERAGVGEVRRDRGAPAPRFPHAAVFRHAEAARAGEGSWRALAAILGILERGSA